MPEHINSMERLYFDKIPSDDHTGQAAIELHIERYLFAAAHSRPGRLLDMACGAGYGTHLLVRKNHDIKEAVGVDLSTEAIEYARQSYPDSRITYLQHDAMAYGDETTYDTVVSLETIEHVTDPAGLVKHLAGLLNPGGILIASVPTTPTVDVNPFHLHDFSERSFCNLLRENALNELARLHQIQRFQPLEVMRRKGSRMENIRPGMLNYYLTHPQALSKRLWSTLRYGFTNRYIAIACQKEG